MREFDQKKIILTSLLIGGSFLWMLYRKMKKPKNYLCIEIGGQSIICALIQK